MGFYGQSSKVFNDDYCNITPLFSDSYFDWLIADIPYGINVGNMAYLQELNIKGSKNKKPHKLKDWDLSPPTQAYFDEVRRVSKNQIIFGVEYVDWHGLGSGRIKWNKGVADGMSFKNYELAYCSAIDNQIDIDLLWSGMMQAKSLSEPMTMQGNKKLNEKRIHPTQKPVLLYDKLFLDFGFQGMKVLDTHLGSGSIRISADKYGVSEFIGIEKDVDHFNDHEVRWRNYKRQFKLEF